ncbi:MAG TPA: hypothetical protein VGJ77_07585 [Gaiellaceae bacterium]
MFASDSGELPTAKLYTVDIGTGTKLPLTPGGYRSEWAPAASPDGSQIAFVRRQLPPRRLPAMADALVIADTNGQHARPIAHGFHVSDAGLPPTLIAWSPDGRSVAFIAQDSRELTHLFVAAADGGGARPIAAADEVNDAAPSWAPDGTRLAFTGATGELEVIGRDGSGERTLGAVGASPTWTPDGSTIAVVGFGEDGIYLADPDGTHAPRQIVSGPALMPAWSPDGRSLAFVRGTIEQGRMSVVRRDGSGEHAVGGPRSIAPAWAPDGRMLAYVRQRPENGHGNTLVLVTSELHVVRADGSGDRTLVAVRLQRIAVPVWTRRGRSLVYSGEIRANDPEIYVVHADGTRLRALTDNLLDDIDPSWSPDHKRIAFTRGRWEVTQERAPTDPSIYVMSSDGTGARRIAAGANPAWSPDAAKIAFDDGDDVYVVAARGGTRHVVARDPEWRSTEPTWSPDGRRIAFVRADRIMIVAARGGRPRFLTKPPRWDRSPAWSPDGSSIAVDRTRDICIVSLSDGKARCLTRGSHSEAPAWSPDGSQIIFDTWVNPPGHDVLEVARLHGAPRLEWSTAGDAFYPDW